METILSVRGEASRTLEPDYAVTRGQLTVPPGPRAAVLDALASSQQALCDTLRALGGTSLTIDSRGSDLTWSFGSVVIGDHYEYGEKSRVATGQVLARVSIEITARVLPGLSRLAAALSSVDHLDLGEVRWGVDDDNSAWKSVRAEAIRAALARAGDYAEALGGSVKTIDHIADVGLLDASGGRADGTAVRGHPLGAAAGGRDSGVTLEPVPQQISAVIEARVTASTSAAATES